MLLASPSVYAQGRVISDFVMKVAAKDYQSFLDEQPVDFKGHSSEAIPDQSFKKPYKTSLSGISVSLDYQVSIGQRDSNLTRFPFTAKALNTTIIIDNLHLKDKIKKQSGPVSIEVSIEATCKNIKIDYRSEPVHVDGAAEIKSVDGKNQLVLDDFDFKFDAKKWRMTVSKCDGPKGFEVMLKDFLIDYVKDKENYSSHIRSAIQDQLNTTSTQISQRLLQEQSFKLNDEVSLGYHPYLINIDASGDALISGLISVDFKTSKDQGELFVNFTQSPVLAAGVSQLAMPSQIVSALSAATFSNGLFHHVIQPQNDEKLKEIFRNRWGQIFLFPDLMNFKKKADFIFDVYALNPPAVSSIAAQSGVLKIQSSAEIVNQMLAPQGTQHIPYVNFSATAKVPVQLTIIDSKVIASMKGLKLDAAYSWDEAYVKKTNPNKYIDIDYFADSLLDSLKDKTFEFVIGAIKLYGKDRLIPDRFDSQKNQISIMFKKSIEN